MYHVRLRQLARFRVLLVSFAAIVMLYFSGATNYLFEKDYHTQFTYPLDVNVPKLVAQLLRGSKPDVEPVNRFRYQLKIDAFLKCRHEDITLNPPEAVKLLLVVKSALSHFENRRVIRQTWGWEARFSDVAIRTVFLLGVPSPPEDGEGPSAKRLQKRIDEEAEKHKDLVQGDFADNYFNNTVKTMMGFHWAVQHCPKAEFVLFADDDYYVSVKNVLRYLRRPHHYPGYLQRALKQWDVDDVGWRRPVAQPTFSQKAWKAEDEDVEQGGLDQPSSQASLFTGYRFFSKPLRLRTSKWSVSLDEYPFDRFPPYITAGAYLLSFDSLRTMYFASFFTVPFRFDDIYLGILAKKCGIEPLHCPQFYFERPAYSNDVYAYLIASHGFEDPEEMVAVWNEQRSLGNA